MERASFLSSQHGKRPSEAKRSVTRHPPPAPSPLLYSVRESPPETRALLKLSEHGRQQLAFTCFRGDGLGCSRQTLQQLEAATQLMPHTHRQAQTHLLSRTSLSLSFHRERGHRWCHRARTQLGSRSWPSMGPTCGAGTQATATTSWRSYYSIASRRYHQGIERSMRIVHTARRCVLFPLFRFRVH